MSHCHLRESAFFIHFTKVPHVGVHRRVIAEYLKENGEEGNWPEFYGGLTRNREKITVGNRPELQPGGEETFMSYDLPWANASNAPFRLFKSWVHEGGIATPFVVHWPALDKQRNAKDSQICHTPWVLMDLVATCCEIGGADVSADKLEGESFLSILQGKLRLRLVSTKHTIDLSTNRITASNTAQAIPLNAPNQSFGSIKVIVQYVMENINLYIEDARLCNHNLDGSFTIWNLTEQNSTTLQNRTI